MLRLAFIPVVVLLAIVGLMTVDGGGSAELPEPIRLQDDTGPVEGTGIQTATPTSIATVAAEETPGPSSDDAGENTPPPSPATPVPTVEVLPGIVRPAPNQTPSPAPARDDDGFDERRGGDGNDDDDREQDDDRNEDGDD